MLFAVCSIAEFIFHMLFGKSQGGRFTVATGSVTIVGLYGNVTNVNVTSMKIALLCNGAHLFFFFFCIRDALFESRFIRTSSLGLWAGEL